MHSIDPLRRTAREILEQFGLAPFRKVLAPADFVTLAAASDSAPRRAPALTPEVTVWLMLSVAVLTSSMTQGFAQAWGWITLTGLLIPKRKRVTEEAFCLAREKLPLRFWRGLWCCLSRKYHERFGSSLLWKGLRVLAADGTEADVPNVPALVAFFTRPRTKQGESKAPQGRLVALCSVLTGFCVDFKFLSRRCSEHLALQHLIRRLRDNDLLLLDRGFFSLCSHSDDSAAARAFPGARRR